MKITSVHFRHITHFADLKLELNYHDLPITLILADQSAGKTSLLRFSYQALTWFAARYKDLRTAGLVMQDQDILFNRLQAKIDICVEIPAEIGSLAESSNMQLESTHHCDWQLYKTLNSSGVGVSKAETAKLEKMVQLYQHAIKHDPMQGLPLIAYYPAERFVNEVNLLNKNNPLILQPGHAYEIAAKKNPWDMEENSDTYYTWIMNNIDEYDKHMDEFQENQPEKEEDGDGDGDDDKNKKPQKPIYRVGDPIRIPDLGDDGYGRITKINGDDIIFETISKDEAIKIVKEKGISKPRVGFAMYNAPESFISKMCNILKINVSYPSYKKDLVNRVFTQNNLLGILTSGGIK